MTSYFPKKQRPWAILSGLIKIIIYLLKHWPLWLWVGAYVSPISPHIMISYTIHDYTLKQDIHECKYLGLHGVVEAWPHGLCPLMTLIDRRETSSDKSI